MGSALTQRFVIYPMVEENEATGRVAACYGAILESHPFVPSLFKSLAVCPGYLVVAWDQASHALPRDDFAASAAQLLSLAATADESASPIGDEEVRTALGQFVDPLARMLLLASGLLAGLEGALAGAAARATPPPRTRPSPDGPVPSQWDASADDIFGQIRRALDTPIINSLWRSLAAKGLLQRAWTDLAPRVPGSMASAEQVQAEAIGTAHGLQWPVVASPEALAEAEVDDAAAGMSAILDAYVKTLSRVLTLVAPTQ